MSGREKRPLGDRFGLVNFGVNLTRLAPNAMSALRHAHSELRNRGKSIRIQTVLVEANKAAYAKLEAFAATKSTPGFDVKALCGEFVDQIPRNATGKILRRELVERVRKTVRQ